MAIKGAIAKEETMNTLLNLFGDQAFIYGKELRVNTIEAGEPVQLKIVITCAKSAVAAGEDSATPGSAFPTPLRKAEEGQVTPATREPIVATAEEQQAVANLMNILNL